MPGDREILVETTFRTFVVRVDRFGETRLNEAQREGGRLLALELRFGLGFDPALRVAAQRLRHALLDTGPLRLRRSDATLETQRFFEQLRDFLEEELEAGRLIVLEEPAIANVPEQELSVRRPRLDGQPPAELIPRREAPLETSFEVRFVDEVGQAISRLEVQIAAGDRVESVITNAAGVALLEGTTAGSGTVTVLDFAALEQILAPRWARPRIGKAPGGLNITEQLFDGQAFDSTAIKAGVPNTIIVKPKLGRLFAELWDKSGRVRHANRDYTISGPVSLEGTTDADGRLVHEGVPNGDYTLTLTLVHFEGAPDEIAETYDSPLLVLDGADGTPLVRLIGVVPRSLLAQLHMFFNTNKTFLLPTALPSVKELGQIYAQNRPSQLLVVGHADTAGGADYNDQLSLERAESTIAFLKDDVDTWLKNYGTDVDPKKRWGKTEDHLMIIAMPDFDTKPKGDDAFEWYQSTRGLTVDGIAGTETRSALIKEYMSLDDASLDDASAGADAAGKRRMRGDDIDATAHGAGENFPLDDAGEPFDTAPADNQHAPIDRRVELFFFDPEFGISPPPPGQNSEAGSTEYPAWRQRVTEIIDLRADALDGPKVTFIEMADAHFRTNSAVVLPEGEDPDKTGAHEALTSVGVFATALRFNEEHPGRTLLVAGHTDTTNTPAFNQPLSAERAQLTLALLEGGDASRETFKQLAQARHTVADIKQILSWVARALSGFDCDPGTIDDNLASAARPILNFQNSYNAQQATIAPSSPQLKPDGSIGPLTWGAFFDCYELALQQELGEGAPGVQALRDKLVFVDPSHKSLGFSEYFPIEELGVDNFRSQTNRRVEIQFFEPGEEPDIQHALDDSETSDLYLPGHYERTPLEPMPTAARLSATWQNPSAPAIDGQARAMTLIAPGLAPGVSVTFTVFQSVNGGSDTLTDTITAVSFSGLTVATFDGWYNPDLVQPVGVTLPSVTFSFVATLGDRLAKSPQLAYSDHLDVSFTHDTTTQPMSNVDCRVLTAWGVLDVATDGNGSAQVTGLPPGGARLVARDFRLVAGT